jgi:TetR/AcrR family transcriptional regulator, tetracycline repressor protein
MTVARDETWQGWPGFTPPAKGGRSGRADKPQLSREAIVAAAIRIVDSEGLDAVSMRRVAQEFSTGAASLYAYVANKEQLLDLLFDWVMGEIADRWPGTEPTARNWRQLAKDGVRLTCEVLSEHRDLARAFQGRVPFGPNGLRMVETQLAIMRAGGVSDEMAAYSGDLFGQYVVSTVIEHELWRTRDSDGGEAGFAERADEIRDYLAALPKELFPNIVSMAGPIMAHEPEGLSRFELGLEVILRGIATFVSGPPKSDDVRGPAAE